MSANLLSPLLRSSQFQLVMTGKEFDKGSSPPGKHQRENSPEPAPLQGLLEGELERGASPSHIKSLPLPLNKGKGTKGIGLLIKILNSKC